VEIRPIEVRDVDKCAAVLASLPSWFGIPEANAAYVEGLRHLPAWVATEGEEVVGFVAVVLHTPRSAEISVMAVDPALHRRGIGTRLVAAVESWCRDNGVVWLHVKTRGPSTYDDDYEQTRRFYFARGFEALYESLTEWGESNAALVLVKRFGRLPDVSR